MIDCLNILVNELRHLQHGLSPELQNELFMQNHLITACEDVAACRLTCYKHSPTLADQIADLHTSITSYEKSHRETENFFTDRRYRGMGNFRLKQSSRAQIPHRSFRSRPPDRKKKKCFVCEKEGCWSTNHSDKKKDETIVRYKNQLGSRFDRRSSHYITEFEGIRPENSENDDESDENIETFILNVISASSFFKPEISETFFISFEALQNAEIMIINFNHRVFKHELKIITIEFLNAFHDSEASDPFVYVISNRYISDEFYGIMIDTKTSKFSIVGYGQYLAYKAMNDDVAINSTKAGAIYVQFGIGSISSIGSINIPTPIGQIEFHIVKADTPFLLCLADLDRLKVYFNNVENVLVSKNKEAFSMIKRFGHPFLLWAGPLQTCLMQSLNFNPCYLTEGEIRHLHRRFGHPSPRKLQSVLKNSGHEMNKAMLERLTKFCTFCQRHGRSPGRFKFTLREEVNFNFSIIVNIMYIDNSPILHVIDEGTKFQAARWLKEISAKHTWEMLRLC